MSEDNNESKSREFICSCGKNYLSYAALFTHIKQKHDGKAPGPIIRPKSERKRGRPRKNPSLENEISNSDSELPQNGISKAVNNNNNIEKPQEEKKALTAAQLLGCGGFAAFKTYKPESGNPAKKDLEHSRKHPVKRGLSAHDSIERKLSSCLSLNQDKDHGLMMLGTAHEDARAAASNFCSRLHNSIRTEVRKLFQDEKGSGEDIVEIIKASSLYQQLKNAQTPSSSLVDPDSTLMVEGLRLFLKEMREILSFEQDTKVESGDEEHGQLLNEHSYNQVFLFFLLMLQCYISEVEGPGLSNPLIELANFSHKFITEHLPQLVQKHQLSKFSLFNALQSLQFVLYFNNWVVIKRSEADLKSRQTPKKEHSPLEALVIKQEESEDGRLSESNPMRPEEQ